jgi:hypothetical protein
MESEREREKEREREGEPNDRKARDQNEKKSWLPGCRAAIDRLHASEILTTLNELYT